MKMACTVWKYFAFLATAHALRKQLQWIVISGIARWNVRRDVSDLDIHWSFLVLVFDWACPLFVSLAVLN